MPLTIKPRNINYHVQVAHRQSDIDCDDHLRSLSADILPKPNFIPPSLYLLKGLLQVNPAIRFERHVCENECMQFPHLVPSQYRHHVEDCCNKPRCKVVSSSNGKRKIIKPVKRFWYFTLSYVIQCFFGDPAFCELRGTDRERSNGLYQSREAQRLEDSGEPVRDPDASLWSVGCDGGQVFDMKQHSTFMVALRCVHGAAASLQLQVQELTLAQSSTLVCTCKRLVCTSYASAVARDLSVVSVSHCCTVP